MNIVVSCLVFIFGSAEVSVSDESKDTSPCYMSEFWLFNESNQPRISNISHRGDHKTRKVVIDTF